MLNDSILKNPYKIKSNEQPAVTVHLVVHNGQEWIRHILDPLMRQTYPNVKILLLDNASTDNTKEIIINEYPSIRLISKEDNIGIWARQDAMLELDDSTYVLVLTDVIMEPRFIERAVNAMESEPLAGSAQAKIYRADRLENRSFVMTDIIDTIGFRISRALHITNHGHGEKDNGQYDNLNEVFGVEGAAPFFRRSALYRCRVNGYLIDPDYRVGGIGYGDDVDIAWRMRLFGFRHIFVPSMIGWHDRSTTKEKSKTPILGQLSRVKMRRRIPIEKRRLDWSNVRFTIIKNAFISNVTMHLPRIITRELAVLAYTILFEPRVLKETGRFLRLLPKMLQKRKYIMKHANLSYRDIERWMT